jgi:hypothetical protein
MKRLFWLLVLAVMIIHVAESSPVAGAITPEQMYQPEIEWGQLISTWEVLPDHDPLAERGREDKKPAPRVLMTLRKDGTCRLFNDNYPAGTDGLWTFESHKIFIALPDASRLEYFVYGIRGDFMMTRSPVQGGADQLWSRVK